MEVEKGIDFRSLRGLMLIPDKNLYHGISEAPSCCKESMKFLDDASVKMFLIFLLVQTAL